MQHMLIDDSPSQALHQLGMWDGVEVLGQIRVNDIRVTLMQQLIHLLHRILRTPLRPVGVSTRLQVRLENRLNDQLGRGLRYSVPYGRDSERTLSATLLFDHLPPYRTQRYPGLYVLSCRSFPSPFNHSF